jgi:Tol biopolymer transport system component
MPAAGGEMQPFTSDPTPEWHPAWSPNGREIAFYAYRSGNREIWAQPVGGGPARQLTKGEAESVFPRWSPDSKTIAFASRASGPADIWTVPAAGGQATLLVGEPKFENSYPFWSSDGQSVFYRSNRSGSVDLWRVPPAGGTPQLVLPLVGGASVLSRDGRSVYSIRPANPPNERTLWISSLDGKTARPITALTGKRGFIHGNALSSDDKFLYFTWEEGASDVWVMDIGR